MIDVYSPFTAHVCFHSRDLLASLSHMHLNRAHHELKTHLHVDIPVVIEMQAPSAHTVRSEARPAHVWKSLNRLTGFREGLNWPSWMNYSVITVSCKVMEC